MDEIKNLIEKGKKLLDEGKTNEALYYLQVAAKNNPEYADIHNYMGSALSILGRYDEAVKSFLKSIEINPRYIEAHVNLGLTYSLMGKIEEAEREFAIVEELEVSRSKTDKEIGFSAKAKIANLHKDIGLLYLEIKMYDEAIDEFRKALRLTPDFPDISFYLAKALSEKGDIDSSIKLLETLTKEKPDFISAYLLLGRCYYKIGDKKKAKEIWEEGHKIDPTNKKLSSYLKMLEGKDEL
uniref:Tetratricopeptide repeat protein n=1 Tax=candidate division WOR-3 bacterium TaxID=2052148 RepID=A0A7C4U657_UNCW3